MEDAAFGPAGKAALVMGANAHRTPSAYSTGSEFICDGGPPAA